MQQYFELVPTRGEIHHLCYGSTVLLVVDVEKYVVGISDVNGSVDSIHKTLQLHMHAKIRARVLLHLL